MIFSLFFCILSIYIFIHCSIAHGTGSSVHMEYDRSVGYKWRHRVASTRFIENLYDRLHHRIFNGQFYVFSCGIRAATSSRLSFISHVYTIGIDCGHVVDQFLDQTRGNPSSHHARSNITIDFRWVSLVYIDCLHYDTEGIHKPFYSLLISFQSHSKYTITTIAATCFVCESRRYLDVIVFGVRVYVVDGICGGQ